jgi:hypothetical protein
MALVRPQLNQGPGVYLQEVPSGVHTITGVPTSITAFLGRTLWGPVNEAITVSSFDAFQSQFGGLMADSPMTYTVQDFFLNGGSTAVVIRLFAGDPVAGTAPIPAAAPAAGAPPGAAAAAVTLNLVAASPGAWGKQLSYSTDRNGCDSASVLKRYTTDTWAPKAGELFNLTLTRTLSSGKTQSETYSCVSVKEEAGGQFIGQVLEQSSFARYAGPPLPVVGNAPAAPAGADSATLTNDEYDAGLKALKKVDVFNLLCLPPDRHDGDVITYAVQQGLLACAAAKATLLVDPPVAKDATNPDKKPWTDPAYVNTLDGEAFAHDLGISVGDEASRFAAIYYPRVLRADPFLGGNPRKLYPACGAIAGIIARTDATRGVWKAPAGFQAGISGIQGLADKVDDYTTGVLNSIGVNCLRSFPATGPVVWGARTARGSDILSDDYKYLPVRRLADYIESTLVRQTAWAVFEPNDEPLWSQLRLSIGSFMADLFRQGAFQGSSRDKAYYVQCDATTTTQSDIDMGIVNVQIGFAPLKPAEFVVLYLQQIAGQGDS